MTGFGAPHLHLQRTDSTNDRARELALGGAPSGAIVTAAEQTAGRGRAGRVWSAPPGGALLFSALLRPLELAHRLLPLAVPLAVCEAVESVGGAASPGCLVKWPNDVWIEGRKVAGVLIEARPPEWAVIGVGVNVAIADDEFPPDLRWPATSIGADATVGAVREALCRELGRWVDAAEADVLAAFRERDALAGRDVGWEGAERGTGRATGVDERGNLVVETREGEELHLGSGEVSLRFDRQ